ncbi:hypothetical protein DAMA08_019860 [Martiniozyma asiatica (nom. inval.)]|nr:hypothetical protein DAMA08_019860 [Martiniozyma asiatica]
MTTLFITSAFKDFLPNEEPSRDFVSYCLSLYSSSKLTVPLSSFELARVHLCVYLAIKQSQNYTDPGVSKIPVPKSKLKGVLADFEKALNPSTPSHRRTYEVFGGLATPQSQGKNGNATMVTPTKSVVKSLHNKLVAESNFSGTHEIPESFSTPPSTPVKRARGRPKKNATSSVDTQKTPFSTPQKRTNTAPSTPRKKRQLITTPDLVSLCNAFYIPEHMTSHIFRTYKKYRHAANITAQAHLSSINAEHSSDVHTLSNGYIKSGSHVWGLLIGLVGMVYRKLNASELETRLGLWKKVITNLHRLQRGGLSIEEVEEWVNICETRWGNVKWARESEYEHTQVNTQTSEDSNGLDSLGCFLTTDYLSTKKKNEWLIWKSKMQEVLEKRKLPA